MRSDRPRRVRVGAAALAALSVAGLLCACTSSEGTPADQAAAQQFLSAVGRHDAAAAAQVTTSPATAKTELQADLTGLGADAKGTLRATASHAKGDTSTVDFAASWTLPDSAAPWKYVGHVALTRTGKTWRVRWSPADLHPALTTGTHLLVTHVQPARAALLASDGTPLFAKTAVVTVGIEPKLVKNLSSLARTLAAVAQLQSTAGEITKAVKAAAHPTDFVPVITVRRTVYEQVRTRIHDLDGTVFQTGTEVLPPSAHFGEPLLGSVGPATADLIAKSKGRLAPGDETGIGGLQQAYDSKLAGTTGVTVVAADPSGATVKTLATVSRPEPGAAVTVTIDRATQQAAETALSGVSQAAAIVAVQRSTGRILADANTSAATYDYGLAGAFPPGSTFKIATWTAAFTATPSLTASSSVTCPRTITVDGRHFENENKFGYAHVPVTAAFGYSCNTSAIAEAMRLPSGAVAGAAKSLGLGAKWSLPVTAFAGSVPTPTSQTEQAADAIGQGRVLASPLLMALLAGAVTSGTPVSPSLLAGKAVQRGKQLPSSIVTKMTALMKATVQLEQGTGHRLADLDGVEGKTGTAEYGNATPPRSHAWFAGVQGDLAFAVFVYDGASQHVDPTALTHTFLEGLPNK